jgi:predicted Zn-dependent protease
MTAESAIEMEGYYRRRLDKADTPFSAADRYGYALALKGIGSFAKALQQLDAIQSADPGHFWIPLARAELLHQSGQSGEAEARFERLLAAYPRNRAVVLSFAKALLEDDSVERGLRAQEVLRPLLVTRADDPALQRSFGRASEVAGDIVRAGEAHAEYAFLTGSAPDAVKQLEALKLRDDLDYYQRARIDARIAAMTPKALEIERKGRRNPDRFDQAPSHSWR